MKRFLPIAIALVMVFALVACGDGSENKPPKGYDKEFAIYVNGSDEWTPFAGKSGVSYTVSDDKVISVSDDGKKIEFTGKQIGESVITAVLDGTESKALVRVRAMEKDGESAAVPLIRELPGSFYIEYTNYSTGDITYYCLTENSYSKRYFDHDEARYGWNIDHYTPDAVYDYWEGYGWIDTTDDSSWTSNKWTNWKSKSDEPIFYGDLCHFRDFIVEKGASVIKDISRYDTGKTEIIAGVECKIYEHGSAKFWVEPVYHFTLKYSNSGDLENEYTVTKYEVPYTEENPFVPENDAVIHKGN